MSAQYSQASVEKRLEELMTEHNEELAIRDALIDHADAHGRNVRNLKIQIDQLNLILEAL